MAEKIGKYIVQDVLGEGSFGIVYQALDPDLQKSVAIKKLKVEKTQREGEAHTDVSQLFAREAQDTSKLTHPNIVTVHGLGQDESDGRPYLVMELLEGETLEAFIKKGAHAPLVQKIEIMHQVAEGLQFAHNKGVIHRDIKPANIMILSDGTAKVMDFAVAPEGFSIGTPAYMAPEQFTKGQGADVLTDIFAYGAVYYAILTGNLAYDRQTPQRTQESRYEPPRVVDVVENCPPWLDYRIGQLLAKRRDERLDNLEEMLVETRPVLQKLKQERGAELAAGIAELLNKGDEKEASQLIQRVLRLDPLNGTARAARTKVQGGLREKAQAKARELLGRGESEFAALNFQQAVETLEEALELDAGNPAIEKALDKARAKAEDSRTSQLLADEVIDEILAAGPGSMPSWLLESAFQKIIRATRLDPRNEDAAALRTELTVAYEAMRDRKSQPGTNDLPLPPGGWETLYDKRIKEAQKARRNREFAYAREILMKLAPTAVDDRAHRELNAVDEDQHSYQAAEAAIQRAAAHYQSGDVETARKVLDDFAELFPRRAKVVEDFRRGLEAELNRREAADTASSDDSRR